MVYIQNLYHLHLDTKDAYDMEAYILIAVEL